MTKEALRPIWRYKWLVLIFVVLAAGAAHYESSRQTKKYDSTASVQLQSGLQAAGQFIDQNTLMQLANTYQSLAGTDTVASRAAGLVLARPLTAPGALPAPGASTTTTTIRTQRTTLTTVRAVPGAVTTPTTAVPAQVAIVRTLKNDVTISQETEVTVLDFVAETSDPRVSQQYSQAYADAFVQYVTDYQNQQRADAQNRIATQVAQIEVQLRQIPPQLNPALPDDPTRTALNTELQSLQMQAAQQQSMPRDSATLVQPADLPTSPVSPSPNRDAALAALGALVIGLALAYVRGRFTERYQSADEVARDLNLPVLAEIPKLGDRAELRIEAFRTLRTSVMFALRSEDRPVVLTTSAEESAGKSFVTFNLATSLALDGRHVAAVDADLRRPTLHQLAGIPASPGLSDALFGRLNGSATGDPNAAIRWSVGSGQPSTPPPRTSIRIPATPVLVGAGMTIDVAPAGSMVRERPELLNADKLDRILAGLRERYDAVVIDSPPIGAVVDAAIIAGRGADGVVLVVNARSTRRRDLTKAVESLRKLDVPLLGFVFNLSADRRARYAQRYATTRKGDANR